jgi:hypothetical protein
VRQRASLPPLQQDPPSFTPPQSILIHFGITVTVENWKTLEALELTYSYLETMVYAIINIEELYNKYNLYRELLRALRYVEIKAINRNKIGD